MNVFFPFIIYSFLAALGLCYAHGLSLIAAKWRLLSNGGAWASCCRGFFCCRARALECTGFRGCSMLAQWLWHLSM